MPALIPDRWVDYKPIGNVVEGTRFVAFKVPLRWKVSKTVDRNARLDSESLLENLPNLGIIIDLTNTNRYYDPQSFEKKGVGYHKIMVPGHVTPAKTLVNKFKICVLEFLSKNWDNDKLVGVHCTHGVNRTGYLICNYMISVMSFNSKEAISRFNAARGHKIERSNYIKALHALAVKHLEGSEIDSIDEDPFKKSSHKLLKRSKKSHGSDRYDHKEKTKKIFSLHMKHHKLKHKIKDDDEKKSTSNFNHLHYNEYESKMTVQENDRSHRYENETKVLQQMDRAYNKYGNELKTSTRNDSFRHANDNASTNNYITDRYYERSKNEILPYNLSNNERYYKHGNDANTFYSNRNFRYSNDIVPSNYNNGRFYAHGNEQSIVYNSNNRQYGHEEQASYCQRASYYGQRDGSSHLYNPIRYQSYPTRREHHENKSNSNKIVNKSNDRYHYIRETLKKDRYDRSDRNGRNNRKTNQSNPFK